MATNLAISSLVINFIMHPLTPSFSCFPLKMMNTQSVFQYGLPKYVDCKLIILNQGSIP